MKSARLCLLLSLTLWAGPAAALDARAAIEKAVELIGAGDYELGRTYLEPAVIDGRLSPGERSRAYYVRGFSFFKQQMFVSAYKDYNRALEFQPENPTVLTAVAEMHQQGLGVEPNPELAFAFLERAAGAEHPPAQLRLGHAYLQGIGTARDVEAGREWLEKAAAEGLAPAMAYLGQSYRAGFTDEPDPEMARDWFAKAEAAGSVDALAYLGFMAETGEGGEPDIATAIGYFQRAAEGGSAVARAKLAHAHLTGIGVDEDPAEALDLFRQAASQQHPSGYMGLAFLYETGTGVPKDAGEAQIWYHRAANAGLVEAQLRMAYLGLERGDLPGARAAGQWLSRAAAQDSAQALNDYAWLLATNGHDEVRNGQQAVTLALQAVSRKRSPSYLDTLAAAYAETGKFDRAVETQQEALALVGEQETELLAELTTHLEAFQAGKPWRE